MRIALLVFMLIPVIEMLVLIEVGGQIGGLPTVVLVFLTAIVGVALIRRQGAQTLLKAQQKMRAGSLPAVEVAEGFMLALAGLMLLIPGFVTDTFGALLLLPPFRRLVAASLVIKFLSRSQTGEGFFRYKKNHTSYADGEVIEGEFHKDDKHLDQNNGDKK